MILPESTLNTKLNVKPIVFSLYHYNAYQGPCRYGQGYALTHDYDVEVGQREFENFQEQLEKKLDHSQVNLLPAVLLSWHEDFALTEETMAKAMEDDQKTDLYLIYTLRLSNSFVVELARRTGKPVGLISKSGGISRVGDVDPAARLHALGHPCYSFFDFEDMNRTFRTLRVRKALARMKILFPLKAGVVSGGCQSSFMTLEGVTETFGTSFVNLNAEDVLATVDRLTPEEREQAAKLASQLRAGAKGLHMPAEYMVNDTSFFVAVRKMMEHYQCNAFTIPCFEVCATMELMRRKTTFCLTHSLQNEMGIPSACAGDVGSVIAIAMLMNVARKAPYMGNTMVMDMAQNQCRTLHDVPNRLMKGYDGPELPVEYVSFTLDNWGTTMRYDFSLDVGEPITLINMSPDFRKMAIVKGTITGCDNYLVPECKLAVRYTVSDARKFYEDQQYVGHHYVWVYGDYTQELRRLAKAYGMETLEV
jgi:hypothetical protein